MLFIESNDECMEYVWWRWNLDISTATLSKQFATWYWFQWLYINPQEDVALTSQHWSPWTIRWYSFTNKDISTATLNWTKQPVSLIHCVFWNKNWTHIYFWTHSWKAIYEYTTENWNVQNMTYSKVKDVWDVVQCIWIDDSETYVVVAWTWNDWHWISLLQMSTPWDISTATVIKTATMSFNIHGIFFDKKMKYCIMCEYNASSWKVHQYDRDILNENSPTETHTLWPVWFTIWYANITSNWKKMYASREDWYIYEYSL